MTFSRSRSRIRGVRDHGTQVPDGVDLAVVGRRDAAADVLVRTVTPVMVRTWAAAQVRSHRLRWYRRADRIESLPAVQSWPTQVFTTSTRAGFRHRLARIVPREWDQLVRMTVGTGELGWIIWGVDLCARTRWWSHEHAGADGMAFLQAAHMIVDTVDLWGTDPFERAVSVWLRRMRVSSVMPDAPVRQTLTSRGR